MKKEQLTLIKRIFGILLSVSVIIAGICLVAGCISIYASGSEREQTYSREIVAETFGRIAIPVYASLGLSVIGFGLEFIPHDERKKEKGATPYVHILNRLKRKKNPEGCDPETFGLIQKERKARRNRSAILTALLIISVSVFLIYALNPNNYHPDINASVIKAMYLLIPCLFVPFVFSVVTVYLNERSTKREIELLKQAPNAENSEESTLSRSDKILFIARMILLVSGIGILIYGYFSGGTVDVLTKAANICTECIGLG